MSIVTLNVEGQEITCRPDESVLDALLREGVDIDHSCRQGLCQSCLVQSLQGPPPADSQTGLKEVLRDQNYFLACRCYPKQDMAITIDHTVNVFTEAKIIELQPLNPTIVGLTVELPIALDCYPGQYVNFKLPEGLLRSYSIASKSAQGRRLSFHIRRLEGGRFSEWIHRKASIGDSLSISNPQGFCYYLPNNLDQGLLLIGTGSGLAPLAGIISDALARGHRGPIHLYHGSRTSDGLYWIDEMRELAEAKANFQYFPCVSGSCDSEAMINSRANEAALLACQRLNGWRIYVCGNPDMVQQTKRQAFMQGASLNDIYADAFHLSPSQVKT